MKGTWKSEGTGSDGWEIAGEFDGCFSILHGNIAWPSCFCISPHLTSTPSRVELTHSHDLNKNVPDLLLQAKAKAKKPYHSPMGLSIE